MTTVPRFRAWKVQRDREVFSTPEGPVIAERGAVVALVVADSFEAASSRLLRLLDKEPDADDR